MSDLPSDVEEPTAEDSHDAPEDWMMPARADGQEWGAIGEHVAQASTDAEAEGHSTEDVDKYLGYQGTSGTTSRATQDWSKYFTAVPDALGKLANGAIDLFAGDWHGDYAKAMRDNEAKTPQDFADAYGAGALAAGHAEGRLDDKDEAANEQRRRGISAAAEALAGVLPSRQDFVDASLSLTDDLDTAQKIRGNLVDHWQDTGQHPSKAVAAARLDPEFGSSLTGTATGSFVHGATESLVPGLAGLLTGAGTGAAAGAIAGPVGAVVGGISGALAGAVGMSYLQEAALGYFPATAKWLGLDPETREFDEKVHPYLRFAGGLAGGAAGLSPFAQSGRVAEQFAARAIGAALQGGVEGGQEYFTNGELDPVKVVGAIGTGALFPGLNVLGQHIAVFGHHVGFSATGELQARTINPAAPGGISVVPFEETLHNPLLHAEAHEAALDPGFAQRLASSESGKLDLDGRGGDTEAKKRPAYSLKEEEKPTDAYAGTPGHKTFQIHKDGEPIGFAEATFPPERPGVAVLDNIASDERAGSMGPRAVRSLAEDFFKMHPDVQEIEGFRVSGARVQTGEGPGTMTIRRDQIERKPPQQVNDLAQGYQAAHGFYGALNSMAGHLLKDESGSLTLWKKPPALALEDQRYRDSRDFFERSFVSGLGERVGAPIKRFAQQLEPFYKDVNPHMPEFTAEHDKGPQGNTLGTMIGNLYQHMEGRTGGAMLRSDSKLAPLADAIRAQNQDMRTRMEDAGQRGLHDVKSYWDDYFKHMWEDPNGAERVFRGMGLLGNAASFQARKYPTIQDGLAAGLKLAIPHPIDMQLYSLTSTLKYLNKLEMLDEAVKSGWATWDHPGPNTTPLSGTGYGGKQAMANNGYARLWNNTHDQGMFNHPIGQSTYDTLLHGANTLTALKLVNPVVHMAQISLATVTSGMADTAEALGRGQLLRATAALTRAVPVVGGAQYWEIGRRGYRDFLKGNGDEAIDMLTRTNFRALGDGRGTAEIMGRNPDLFTSIFRNAGGDTFGERVGNVVKAAVRTQWDRLKYDFNGTTDETTLKTAGMIPFRLLGHTAEIAGTAMTTATDAIFGRGGTKVAAIPNIQLGAALTRMRSYLAANPMASEDVKLRRAIQIRADIENRMGELNQDNAFWNKKVKQIANLSLLSTGWKYGTYRGLASAVGRNIDVGRWEFNPVSLTSTIGTGVAWAAVAATYQYLHTGSFPWQTDTPIKDMIDFRTGGVPNKGGTPRRAQEFGEPKELVDLAKVYFSSISDPMHSPAAVKEYAMSATNPLWQLISAGLTGEDAIGHRISQYPGGWNRYVKEQLEPIFLNMFQNQKKGTGLTDWEQAVLGTRDAPSFIQDPEQYLKGMAGIRQKWSKEELTRARKEASQLEYPEELQEYIKQAEAEQENAASQGRKSRASGIGYLLSKHTRAQ